VICGHVFVYMEVCIGFMNPWLGDGGGGGVRVPTRTTSCPACAFYDMSSVN
jgi:hypothetical protein